MWGLWPRRAYATSPQDVISDSLQGASVAVLLVDMQPTYVQRVWGPERRALIQSQSEMLKFCAEQDIPTAIIETQSRTIKGQKPNYTEDTASYLQRRIRAVPRHTQPIKKEERNAFSNPELIAALRAWNTTHVLLMGVTASGCVQETAAGALKEHLEIIVAETLIADSQGEPIYADIPLWYQQNGTYCFDHRKLMSLLKQ